VKNSEQCTSSSTLSGICDIYNYVCKVKCSTFTSRDTCTEERDHCFWLFDSPSSSSDSGVCKSKTDPSLECIQVKRESQCGDELVGTLLEGICTFYTAASTCVKKCELLSGSSNCRSDDCGFIYLSEDGNDDGGSCYAKNSTHTCEEINRSSQCVSGGNIGVLNGKCGIYGGICKTKCSELGTEITTCTSDNRVNDCFLLENGDGSANSCVNKVC
jgi:hypothetical protein